MNPAIISGIETIINSYVKFVYGRQTKKGEVVLDIGPEMLRRRCLVTVLAVITGRSK
jgi:hypothetical protein